MESLEFRRHASTDTETERGSKVNLQLLANNARIVRSRLLPPPTHTPLQRGELRIEMKAEARKEVQQNLIGFYGFSTKKAKSSLPSFKFIFVSFPVVQPLNVNRKTSIAR